MTRKKKLLLYIAELERELDEIAIKLDWYSKLENDVDYISLQHYRKKLISLERVINTLMLISH